MFIKFDCSYWSGLIISSFHLNCFKKILDFPRLTIFILLTYTSNIKGYRLKLKSRNYTLRTQSYLKLVCIKLTIHFS